MRNEQLHWQNEFAHFGQILVTEMTNVNCITLSHSHFGGHWRNFNHQCEGVWSESSLTCRTMASSQQSAQSTSVRHRAEYISQRLYKNPSMSHCADATMPLFISTEAGDSSNNVFNSLTCEGVQRGRGTVGLKKNIQTGATYMEAHTKSSFLFFDDVLSLMCLTNTNCDVESGSLLVRYSDLLSVSRHIWWTDVHFCAGLQRSSLNDLESSDTAIIGLPWNLMHTFIFPSGWILMTLVTFH